MFPEDIVWVTRNIQIKNPEGKVIFEQKDVECPEHWSYRACCTAVHKYFHGNIGDEGRECSIKHLIERIVKTITRWGIEQDYFTDSGEDVKFAEDLCNILVNQLAAFNTPVWINFGIYDEPQGSACFITSCGDHLEDIGQLYPTEMDMFRFGSGNGTNLSNIRGMGEPLSEGGFAAGPIPFMKGLDFSCAAMKSGGRMRRGASLRRLDIDHPDIIEFMQLKQNAEAMAQVLIANGFDPNWEIGVYKDLPWQNANNSIGITDAFMKAVREGGEWELTARTTGKVTAVLKARDLWNILVQAAWSCGCPGIHFHDTINKSNTCATDGIIRCSNPCGEYHWFDDSSCNLVSMNLPRFWSSELWFNTKLFEWAIRVVFKAMDIIIDKVHYPTEKIAAKTKLYRPLGLGHTGVGGLLMRSGVPYDSDAGRQIAATITAFMHGIACDESADLAAKLGPFERYAANAFHVRNVLHNHWEALDDIPVGVPDSIILSTLEEMIDKSELYLSRTEDRPVRNAQFTLLAPCGTISYLMDCDTTGVEADVALVRKKQLVGGEVETVTCQALPFGLQALGYHSVDVDKITTHVAKEGSILDCKLLEVKDRLVFATAYGDNVISWRGHILMVAAVQPFLSGSVSKTVALPEGATLEEVSLACETAWTLGIKSLTIYRDHSKKAQPITAVVPSVFTKPIRKELPDERSGCRGVKLKLGDFKAYVHTGEYEDGKLGEAFVRIGGADSDVQGIFDIAFTGTSIGLQHGIPLEEFRSAYAKHQFLPGWGKLPGDDKSRQFKSFVQLVMEWLNRYYGDPADGSQQEVRTGDEPFCLECGCLTIRSGSCFLCQNCGNTTGCS